MTETAPILEEMPSFAVYSAGHAYNRVYKPLLDTLGLTFPQYLVMILLWERDGQTVGQLCSRLLVEASTVTPLLQRLESQGVLKRVRDTDDRRLVWAQLTDRGRALREEAGDVPSRVRLAMGWPEEETQGMTSLLTRLRQNLMHASRGIIPPAETR